MPDSPRPTGPQTTPEKFGYAPSTRPAGLPAVLRQRLRERAALVYRPV